MATMYWSRLPPCRPVTLTCDDDGQTRRIGRGRMREYINAFRTPAKS